MYDSIGESNPICPQCFTTLDMIEWASQVAEGLRFLKEHGIVHGDLSARNILLYYDKTAKITDFGLSRTLRRSEEYCKVYNVNMKIEMEI